MVTKMDRGRFIVFKERLKTDEDFAEKWSRCNSQKEQVALLEAAGLELPRENSDAAAKKLSEEDMAKVVGGASMWDVCIETNQVCQFLTSPDSSSVGFDCRTCPHDPTGIVPFQ
jgi:predicted ribosomally synthesized peptide with nif11-like leader